MILGYLPQDFDYDHQRTTFEGIQFTGCLRNIQVSSQLLDFSDPLLESGVTLGCQFTDAQCSPNPCENGGRCIGMWESFVCECSPQYSGPNCTQCKLPPHKDIQLDWLVLLTMWCYHVNGFFPFYS